MSNVIELKQGGCSCNPTLAASIMHNACTDFKPVPGALSDRLTAAVDTGRAALQSRTCARCKVPLTCHSWSSALPTTQSRKPRCRCQACCLCLWSWLRTPAVLPSTGNWTIQLVPVRHHDTMLPRYGLVAYAVYLWPCHSLLSALPTRQSRTPRWMCQARGRCSWS